MGEPVFLISDDTDWNEEPVACTVIKKFVQSEREYWLVHVSPPFVVPTYSAEERAQERGRFGERTNSAYLVLVPRHKGVTFARLPTEAVCVHVAVPKSGCYPPRQDVLMLDDYVHLIWGLVYPSYEQAKRRDFFF